MMHYSKGENVEKEITKSDLPFEDCMPKDKDFLWMKVRGGTKVNNVISHAKNALEKGEHRTLIWTGAGGGLVKTVSCAEIIKRSFPLYQLTRMCYTSTEEHWKPQLEGLEEIVANRQIPCLHILMSLDRIDVKGVQEPNTTTEFWSEDLISPSTSRRPDNNEHRQQHQQQQPQQKEETNAGSSQKKRNRSKRQMQQSQQGSQQSHDQQNDHQRPQNQQSEVKKSQKQPQRPQDQQKKIKQQQRPQHPQNQQQQQQSGQPLQKNKPQKQQQQNQQQQQNKDKLCQSTSQGQKQPKTREQPQQRRKKPKEARTEAADPARMEI